MNHKAYAAVLGGLAFVFFLRVLGQALVALDLASVLPPMEEWYSGLVPYRVLLPIQILILVVQAMISRDIWRGRGLFARHRSGVGLSLRWFSYIYFAAMVVHYVLTMMMYPERRWLTGTIPIFFHWVLAGFILLVGYYHWHIRTDLKGTLRENL